MSREIVDLARILGSLCGMPGAIFLLAGLFNKPGRALVGGVVLTLAWGVVGYLLPVDSWMLIPARFVATGVTAHALNAVTFALTIAVIAFWRGKGKAGTSPHSLAVLVLFMAALTGSGVAVGLIRQVVPQPLLFTMSAYGLMLALFASLLLMILGSAMMRQSTGISNRYVWLVGVSLSVLAAVCLLVPYMLGALGIPMLI